MDQRFDRRTMLRSIVVLGAASVLPGCGSDNNEGEQIGSAEESARRFPQGVASGDPRQTTVILWTRALNPASSGDVTLRLEVALDSGFSRLVVQRDGLPATLAHDNCIKVRLKGLTAATTYYYRFSSVEGRTRYRSTAGRTRTAPDASADVQVRFAVANCQDYVGRYWNSYQQLLTAAPDDLDFFLSIGDYIYEQTQPNGVAGGARAITFTTPSEAIDLGSGNLAAKSVGNYRDIYRTYRSDPLLQQAHSRWPIIATWDDHEYSDDCWRSVATYFDGLKDEKDDERRRNAEQVFFEYLPVDEGTPGNDPQTDVFTTERAQLYPNQKLWRTFTFGKHLELVMTDYRSFRPDHPVPENAFPGTVVADQATLIQLLGQPTFDASFPVGVAEYVDVDTFEDDDKTFLTLLVAGAATQAGMDQNAATAYAQQVVQGKLGLVVVNALLTAALQPPLPSDGLERGLFYALIGKQSLFTPLGSRYVTVKNAYDLYTALLYARTSKASENAFGDEQESFVVDRLTQSTATHKVMVSSVSLISMQLDLSAQQAVPAQLRRNFYFDVDQWDGFPNKRAELLTALSGVSNLVALSGDIHGAFAGNEKAMNPKIALLTAPAISSLTMGEQVGAAVSSFSPAPEFQPPNGAIYQLLTQSLPLLLQGSTGGAIKYVSTTEHGFLTVGVDNAKVRATFTLIPASEVSVDYSKTPSALPAKVKFRTFDIAGGVLTEV